MVEVYESDGACSLPTPWSAGAPGEALTEIPAGAKVLMKIPIESDKLMFLDTVQHTFTDTGPGGGHLVPEGIQMLDGLSGSKDREAELLRL